MSQILSPPTDFAVAVFDGTDWPARPSAQVVRWVGGYEAPAALTGDDFWRADVAGDPSNVPGLIEHFIGDNATGDAGTFAWTSEFGNAVTVGTGPDATSATQNSLGVVDFVPNEYVSTTAFQDGVTHEMTIIFVAKLDDTVDNNIISSDRSSYLEDILIGVDANKGLLSVNYPNEMSVVTHQNTGGSRLVHAGDGDTSADTTSYHMWTVHFSVVKDLLSIQLDDGTPGEAAAALVEGDGIIDRVWDFGRNGTGDRYFNGKLAEVCFFDRSLGSNEVSEIYKYMKARYAL